MFLDVCPIVLEFVLEHDREGRLRVANQDVAIVHGPRIEVWVVLVDLVQNGLRLTLDVAGFGRHEDTGPVLEHCKGPLAVAVVRERLHGPRNVHGERRLPFWPRREVRVTSSFRFPPLTRPRDARYGHRAPCQRDGSYQDYQRGVHAMRAPRPNDTAVQRRALRSRSSVPLP